jgi:hypothetical protein
MRAHGVDMSDPVHLPGHSGLSINLPTPSPATNAAYASCRHLIQPLIDAKTAHARALPASTRLALIHYAECMREHGIAMLDPGPLGSLNLGPVPGMSNAPGRYSPQFRFADQVCRRLLPPTIHDDGTGP